MLETADKWLKIHRKSDGDKFYVVPGSNGRVYWTNCRECDCPDATTRNVDCKHQIAVRLYVAKVKAGRPDTSCGICSITHKCHCPRLRSLCPTCEVAG